MPGSAKSPHRRKGQRVHAALQRFGAVTTGGLAERLGMQRGRLVALLGALVKKGLVRRVGKQGPETTWEAVPDQQPDQPEKTP